jgi:nicotinate-nucleotide adenylyltransferase
MSITKQNPPKLIAVLGGTFDPIHLGHTLPAQETAKWIGAEKLFLIPAHIPPHKLGTHANAKQRAEMVSLVCANNDNFMLDSRELNRHTPSFTVDTLNEIKAEHPNTSLYFIMGMDSLLTFTTWHCWQEILTICNLVVNIRPGYSHLELEDTLAPELSTRLIFNLTDLQPQKSGQIVIHESKPVNISSTEIRARIKAGLDCSQYLEKPVFDFIKQHKLYS